MAVVRDARRETITAMLKMIWGIKTFMPTTFSGWKMKKINKMMNVASVK